MSELATGAVRYENPAICATCGGKCCKSLPGAALPTDFAEPLADSLEAAFSSGLWAIDWWEGDPRGLAYDDPNAVSRGYFLRPRTVGKMQLYDPSWGGECVHLGNKGCALPYEKRPAGCRLLEPSRGPVCPEHGGSKREAAIAWLPYHKEIEGAASRAHQNGRE